MTIRSLDELSAAARKAADEALDAALAAAPTRLRGTLPPPRQPPSSTP